MLRPWPKCCDTVLGCLASVDAEDESEQDGDKALGQATWLEWLEKAKGCKECEARSAAKAAIRRCIGIVNKADATDRSERSRSLV